MTKKDRIRNEVFKRRAGDKRLLYRVERDQLKRYGYAKRMRVLGIMKSP